MIGYRISRAALEALIDQYKPDWRTRAAQRTAEFKRVGRYDEKSSIWSEIKPVYMTLQGGSKCAFCERKLESVPHGTGEQDVEHFRPKRRITPWPGSAALQSAGVAPTAAPPGNTGYPLLPYDLFNYSAACKPCNSSLKRDCFPIAGVHDLLAETSESIAAGERPLLIYPVGDFDEDPEALITFHGASPAAVAASGHRRHRALTTIEFFKLDDLTDRKNLFRDRATIITALYPQLECLRQGTASAAVLRTAQRLVDGYTAAHSQHANCARSFRATHAQDPHLAEQLFEAAAQLIESGS